MLKAGQAAPDFALPDQNGDELSLAELAQRFQSRMIQLAGVIFSHTIENHARFTPSTKIFSYLWTN